MILEDLAEKITSMQTKRPFMFLLAFLVVTALLLPGILNLVNNVEPSLEKVLPQDIEEVKTMNDMRTQFGADMMYLLVYAKNPVTDVRNPALLSYIDQLSEKLRTRQDILEVNNLADMVKQANNRIPDSIDTIKHTLQPIPQTAEFANHDYTFTVIRIRSDTGASAETITRVVEDIETDIASMQSKNPGSEIQITGYNAIDKATFEVIMSDFATITLLSLALVGIVVLVTFRSPYRAFMPLSVVMVSLIWTMGIVGYLGLTITVVTMVSAAMILGLGIDFGIHVVHNYFELRKKSSREVSLRETMKELLRAMVAASLTTMAGFLALLFGVLPAMKTLGIVLALGIFSTLIGAVFLLPVIIDLYDKKILGGVSK